MQNKKDIKAILRALKSEKVIIAYCCCKNSSKNATQSPNC